MTAACHGHLHPRRRPGNFAWAWRPPDTSYVVSRQPGFNRRVAGCGPAAHSCGMTLSGEVPGSTRSESCAIRNAARHHWRRNRESQMPEPSQSAAPRGELTVRTIAMPADTNANGDIFGGWVMAHMDQAGGIAGVERARGRVVTVVVERMTFIRAMRVGDVLEVYTEVESVGRTSMKIHVE